MARRSAVRARTIIDAIHSDEIRWWAIADVAGDLLNIDTDSALRLGASIPASPAREDFDASAARRLALSRPDAALVAARRISNASRRGLALPPIASRYLQRGDTSAARAVFREALSLIDPLAADFGPDVIRPYASIGERERAALGKWAREQASAKGRAAALVAVLETCVR